MAEFLLTGRNEKGRKRTECVEASTADEAVAEMRGRGYEAVVLHTDEATALVVTRSDADSEMSPRQRVRIRGRGLAGIHLDISLSIALSIYRKVAVLLALAFLLHAMRWYTKASWSPSDWLLVFWLVLPLLAAFVIPFLSTRRRRGLREFDAAEKATAWARWSDALRHIEELKRLDLPIPPEMLEFKRARALAGSGRWDDAVTCAESIPVNEGMPGWLHSSLYSEVYFAAGRMDEAFKAIERGFEIAPDKPEAALEMARWEIREYRNPVRAGRYLAMANEHATSELLGVFARSIEGMIKLESGRPREARELLEQALSETKRWRGWSSFLGSHADEMKWALALTCAAQGDLEAAERYYKQAKPRLEAHKLHHLMERYERAVGRLR